MNVLRRIIRWGPLRLLIRFAAVATPVFFAIITDSHDDCVFFIVVATLAVLAVA